jgi:hypothetical protein
LDGSLILDRLVLLPEAGSTKASTLQVDRVSIPRVTIDNGRLTLVDLGLRFKEVYGQASTAPAIPGTAKKVVANTPPATPPTNSRNEDPPHEIHASGEVQWSWTAPLIHQDAAVDLRVTLPQQKLSLIRALAPGLSVVADGDIEGRVGFKGTYAQLTNPGAAFAQGVEPPILSGGISVVASRLRFGSMTTALGEVDLNLRFEGDALKAESKTKPGTPAQLFIDVVDPSNNKTLSRSDPVIIQGELPIQPGVKALNPLTITSNKIRFLEAPLPFFNSGRAVGEIAGRTAMEQGLNITITDHLLAPHIAGDVRIQRADLRLPDAITQDLSAGGVAAIQPTFDLRMAVGENVRATASTLTARVTTAPAAPITLKGSLSQPLLDGTLQVVDGSLSFPTARFTLQRGGTVALKYPAYATTRLNDPAFGVFVDVIATTRLVAQSITGETKRYTVTVHARGPLNSAEPADLGAVASNPVPADRKLQLEFNSDPSDLALSQAGLEKKITSLLGGQDAIQNLFQGGQGAARALEGQLASMISQRLLPGLLDSAGVASWLGFDELSLGYDTYDQLSLRASRRLFGTTTISYWRRLTNITSTGGALRGMWELKLSQPLRRNLLFSITTGDQRVNAFLLEGVFRF